jgi:hypothetical protein
MSSYYINKEDSIGFNAHWNNVSTKEWRVTVNGSSYAIIHEENSLDFKYNLDGKKNELINFSTSLKVLPDGTVISLKGSLWEPVVKRKTEVIPGPKENNKLFLIETHTKDSVIKICPEVPYPEGYHFYVVHLKNEKHFNVFFDSDSYDTLIHVGKIAKKGGNYSSKTWRKNDSRKIILFGWEMIHVVMLNKNEWIIDAGIVYEEVV